MRKFITTGALLLAASLLPATLPAQTAQPDSPNNGSAMTKPAMTTVTGCVSAGRKEGTFKLMGDDGTTYMLRSKNTNLSEHVGHTVTVSGHVMTGEKKGSDSTTTPSNSSDPNAGGADQHASGDSAAPASGAMRSHLMVHSLTMVSDSCKTK
jgi:hypothetical protein